MELANLWSPGDAGLGTIRIAERRDAAAIMRLLQTAVYQHLHVDWYLPGDWLGSPGFVLLPKTETPPETTPARFLARPAELVACLAATADPPPTAWVRVAALSDVERPDLVLAGLLARVIPALRQQHLHQLAWLAVEEWPNRWLPALGFDRSNEIETFIKRDRALPPLLPVAGLAIRAAREADCDRLAALEVAAFEPLWRHSARALRIASHSALSFDVAVMDETPVGFQLSARSEQGAHLVRLTIEPAWQRAGIGSALLHHALQGYHRRDLQVVTLNTQVDNIASQDLYHKFGFAASGQRLPVWTKDLEESSEA